MWGILKDMVSTRRSSARLQEKTASAPSSPTPSATQVSPARKTRNSASKVTPPSASQGSGRKSTGSGSKRPRRSASKSGSSESDDGSIATESDNVSEQQENGVSAEENEGDVKKQLFAEEASKEEDKEQAKPEVAEPAEETVGITVVETKVVEEEVEEKVDVTVVEKVGTQQVEEEEEEEIVMMSDSDEEDEDASMEEEPALDDEDDDDEIDIAEFAKMAATGISLSTSSPVGASNATATSQSSKSSYNLVPDALDSGASSRTKFLEFEGSKLALGAKIVADTVAVEEKKVLDQQLGKVAKANRQRAEANNDTSAGRKWFDMSTHEMDADARRDFALLRMRNYLDPKKFYKTSDHTKKMPKHFQFGTVIEGAHEFKSARLSKKDRKQTFTEEIMADDAIRKYTKRVFLQVQNSKAGQAKKKQKTKGRF